MSLPESFSVISPHVSLFKTLTPAQYLAATQATLENLPKWQSISAVVTIVSFGVLLGSLAVSFIVDEDLKPFEEQTATSQALTLLIGLSAISFTTSAIAFGAIPGIYTPILNNRVEWLQAGLNIAS